MSSIKNFNCYFFIVIVTFDMNFAHWPAAIIDHHPWIICIVIVIMIIHLLYNTAIHQFVDSIAIPSMKFPFNLSSRMRTLAMQKLIRYQQ